LSSSRWRWLCPFDGFATAQTLPEALSGRRTVQAIRLAADERITLDGVMDEAVWKRTVPASRFIMQDPIAGVRWFSVS
jgi:hypothetical protein